MAKGDVNGGNRLALFEALCERPDTEGRTGDVRWNFEKFLINTDGDVKRFSSGTKPAALDLS